MKFLFSTFKQIREFFEKYFVVITLLIGTISLFFGIVNIIENHEIKKLLHTIGSLFLASGIFAGIAKSNQFTEIYKKSLRDIIYFKEHLENRKDLENIWETITEVLINKKFVNINSKMKLNIKKYFLPINHDYYYNNFNVDIEIENIPNNNDYILIKETTTYTIVCEDENLNIDNKSVVGIKVDLKNSGLTKYKLKNLFIDNIEKKDINVEQKYEENILISEYKNPLKGKKSYNIKRKEEKEYCIKHNPIRRHLAMWLYNGIKIDITFPKDLVIDFYNMGVLDDFEIEYRTHNNAYNRLKAEYKGLIYKNQGFFIHLRKK